MAFEGLKKMFSTYEEDYEEDDRYEENEEREERNNDYSKNQNDTSKQSSKLVNINATAQLAVVLVKPTAFENAAEIADNLKDKRTVVLNLEQTNQEIARRLIDFLSGVAYANEGKIKRVANNTFIITPYNVNLLGDLMDELENSGLY